MRLYHDSFESPVGDVLLVSDGHSVRALYFAEYSEHLKRWLRRTFGSDDTALMQNPGGATTLVRAYFGGELDALDKVQAQPAGTPFQMSVWHELRNIPGGKTVSYRDLAVRLGRASATRAVGLANGANPISLIYPCHRVIGADGSLTGYGGGLHRKRWLLEHEGALPREAQLSLP